MPPAYNRIQQQKLNSTEEKEYSIQYCKLIFISGGAQNYEKVGCHRKLFIVAVKYEHHPQYSTIPLLIHIIIFTGSKYDYYYHHYC